MSEEGKKPEEKKRSHTASYSTDKRKGGYLVRVEGPNAAAFVGREVPVTMKDKKTEHVEKLERLVWSGKDKETGANVALYTFAAKPRASGEEIQF